MYGQNNNNTYPTYSSEYTSGYSAYPSYVPQDQFVERSREVVHEVSQPETQKSREVYKAGRVFRDEDDLLPAHQTKPAEETVKSSYNYYTPTEQPQYVERSREVVHEVPAEKQKSTREVYKGGRVFRDEDDLLPAHQTKPAEETVKSSYNYHVPQDTQGGFVERNREIVHEVPAEKQKSTREVYKGGRVFRDEDDIMINHQTKPAEETVKSSYNYHVPQDTQGGFVERNREIVHEVPAEKQKSTREVYKGGRVFRDEDDIMITKPAEETVKSSYNYHVPQDTQGGFVERNREIVHEVPAEKQKSTREVYKGGRVFRDEDDMLDIHQVRQTEEAVKSSYNHHAPSEEPQFVERSREFNYEKADNHENALESRKGGRNY